MIRNAPIFGQVSLVLTNLSSQARPSQQFAWFWRAHLRFTLPKAITDKIPRSL